MVPEQIGEYQVVEVKQEIDIGEHEYSDSLITEPLASSSKESQGCPEKGITEESSPAKADQCHDVVVKQEQKDEVGEQDYSENLPTEPLDLAPKPLPTKKVRSKKVPAKKNLPEEGGEPPVKKKMGRPRLTEAQRNQKGQMCAQCGKVVNNLSAHLTMHNQDRWFVLHFSNNALAKEIPRPSFSLQLPVSTLPDEFLHQSQLENSRQRAHKGNQIHLPGVR